MLAIERILLPTDFSDAAADAERRARALARMFEAELHLLHVAGRGELDRLPDRLAQADDETADRLFSHVSSWLGFAGSDADLDGSLNGDPDGHLNGSLDGDPEADRNEPWGPARPGENASENGAPRVTHAVRGPSTPHSGILQYADEIDADLIVIGTRGRGGPAGPLLGSVADRVVRRADRPVVTVRPDVLTPDPSAAALEGGQERLIVVPVDFSEPTRTVVAHAKYWAATFRSRVDLVHVIDPPGPPLYRIDRFRANLPDRAVQARSRLQSLVEATKGPPVDAAVHVLTGKPAEEIVGYARAQRANLILMATHGASGLGRYVLGGVTEQVLRTAPCPVCAVESTGRSLVPDAAAAFGPRHPAAAGSGAPAAAEAAEDDGARPSEAPSR
jgi:nucleotide-binding universal stress UspA family protein